MVGQSYPASWDEPYTPPDDIKGELRDLLVKAHERTLAMSRKGKQEMYEAQRESFIRAMEPCEHGDYDWETCPECLARLARSEKE